MNPCLRITFLLFLTLLFVACKTMTPDAAKRAYCNTLKSDIVFNSATTVTRDANIQATEEPLQYRSFNAAECEQYNALTPQPAP